MGEISALEWRSVEGKQRRWCATSWHETYWVFGRAGHWMIEFGDTVLAGADSFSAAIAFAEWHSDFYKGVFDA